MMSHRFFCALLSVFIIRVDRRGCSYRPMRMLFPMIANHRRVWHPCHTHAATARSHIYAATARSHIISRLRGYSKDAIPSYR